MVVIVLVASAFFGIGIDAGSHFNSDDTLYAEMAREMLESGDWVDNRWSGAVLFEKPPLYLWSLALSGSVLGWGEAAMRLPGTLFGILALVAFFWLARGLELSRRSALAGVGLLAGSYLFVLMTRRLMTDIPLAACLLAAAAALVHGRHLCFGALGGLAVLAKGVAAGPLGLALLIFALIDKRLSVRQLGAAVGVGLLVAAPWHLWVSVRHGAEFWQGYVGYHVGERVTADVVPGLSLTQFLEFALVERLLLGLGVIGLVFALKRRLSNRCDRFALLWVIFTLMPVLLSNTRLPHYLLPTVPGLALLSVRLVPEVLWQHRLAPMAALAVILIAFAAHPDKVIYWLDPDFGPAERELGLVISEAAADEDLVVAYNTTTAALTFYSGGWRIPMLVADPRFYEVQSAVLMVRRAGVLSALGSRDGIAPRHPAGRRFVICRERPDLSFVVARMRYAVANRPLFALRAGKLVLVNDAGVGDPIP